MTNEWNLYTGSKGHWKISVNTEISEMRIELDTRGTVNKNTLHLELPLETELVRILNVLLESQEFGIIHLRGEIIYDRE